QVNDCTAQRLGDLTASVGIMAVTGEDSLFMIDSDTTAGRLNIEETKSLVEGDLVREWGISEPITAIWTYDENNEVIPIDNLSSSRLIFRTRSSINRRRRFGTPMTEIGLAWWEWQEVYFSKRIAALSIAFAFVATHNHFVLDRGGKVFKQSAPVIKLPEGASEDEHLDLLGVLNSSTACFWLKQNSHNKGNGGIGGGIGDEAWEPRYEF